MPVSSGEKIVVRGTNKTVGGACLNTSTNGSIGTDSSSCLILQGSAIYELYYPVLKDSTGCFAIRLKAGNNAGMGKGNHKIKLKYDHMNTTAENGCSTIIKPTVEIDIEWKDKWVFFI